MANKRLSSDIAAILKYYKALEVRFQNINELQTHGIKPCYSLDQDRESNLMTFYKKVNSAIKLLNSTERTIIEHRYMSPQIRTDKEIYIEMNIKKDKYYEHKRQAILTISSHMS